MIGSVIRKTTRPRVLTRPRAIEDADARRQPRRRWTARRCRTPPGTIGGLSVCAYSGCWEGTGEVLRAEKFLVLVGHDLEFSTSRGSESSGADIVMAIDRADGVAALKAGEFAHPLLCKNLGVAQ